MYSPISGTVLEVNTALEEDPELINKEPYENGKSQSALTLAST